MDTEQKNSTRTSPDIEGQIELIRNQVDLLQIESADKKKPWYKQVPIVISIISLMFSFALGTIGFIYQYSTKVEDDINKKIESLNEIMVNISDTRKDLSQKFNSSDKNNISGNMAYANSINNKRCILIDKADKIINELIQKGCKSKIGYNVFISLGYEMFTDARYEEAEKYYKYGLEITSKYEDKSAERTACSALGELYMIKGFKSYDISNGRSRFKQALNTITYENDQGHQHKGSLLLYHANCEYRNNNISEANALVKQAKEHFNKMNPPNIDMINYADDMTKFYAKTISSHDLIKGTAPNSIAGIWTISYPNSTKKGKAIFAPNQIPGGYTVSVDVFEDDKLLYKYGGAMITIDPNTIKIDWQGMGCFDSDKCGQFIGTDLLKFTSKNEYIGRQSIIGLTSRAVRLHKAL